MEVIVILVAFSVLQPQAPIEWAPPLWAQYALGFAVAIGTAAGTSWAFLKGFLKLAKPAMVADLRIDLKKEFDVLYAPASEFGTTRRTTQEIGTQIDAIKDELAQLSSAIVEQHAITVNMEREQHELRIQGQHMGESIAALKASTDAISEGLRDTKRDLMKAILALRGDA